MKLVLAEVKKGSFKTAQQLLNTLEVSHKSAVNVVVACCSVCRDPSLDLDIRDLLDVLKTCVSYIPKSGVEEEVVDRYLSAIYCIMQLVINKVV